MGRLIYFWVDLSYTCVDLNVMVIYLYGRKIAYN